MFKFFKNTFFRDNFPFSESLRRPLENCQATPDGVATHRLGTAAIGDGFVADFVFDLCYE